MSEPGWNIRSVSCVVVAFVVSVCGASRGRAMAEGAAGNPKVGVAMPSSAPLPQTPRAMVVPVAESPTPLGPTGGRVGAAEVTIVGGNVASARERALTEALKQAVDQAIAALVPDARAKQPKLVVQVLGRSRAYVRRYRALEEGERGRGLYGVRIEAEIDESALLRAFDKPASGVVAPGGLSPGSPPAYLLMGAGVPDAADATLRAFTAAGAHVQRAGPELAEPSKAVEAAVRAGAAMVAFVSGSVAFEGKVRGPGLEAVTCAIGVRVLTAGAGLAVADESETVRSFAETSEKARADCLQRAAGAVVPRVVPAAAARVAPDVRTIVLEAAVVQPAAVPALVKQVRAIGSVSAAEVRRITPGRVEVWVRSRLSALALSTALGRDGNGALTFGVPEVTGDLIRVTATLRETGTSVPAGVGPSAVPNNPSPRPTPP